MSFSQFTLCACKDIVILFLIVLFRCPMYLLVLYNDLVCCYSETTQEVIVLQNSRVNQDHPLQQIILVVIVKVTKDIQAIESVALRLAVGVKLVIQKLGGEIARS